ncbi:MAG: TolC family protein [bacterium]
MTPAQHAFTPADLDSYLSQGLEHHPLILAARADWQASHERAAQVTAWPEPKLRYSEFLESVETRTGPQERRFALSQAIPFPGRLSAAGRVQESSALAMKERVGVARLEIAQRIESAYYGYAFLAREIETVEGLLELMRGLEPVIQGRVRTGAGQEDLLRMQVEIGRLEDDLASHQHRRRALSARLAEAAHLPPTSGLLPLAVLEVPETLPVDSARLLTRALDESPALGELAARLQAAGQAEELASYNKKPGFSVSLDYIQTGDARSPSTLGSGEDPLAVGLSISLPVWTSSYAAAEREARQRARAARERLDAGRRVLEADLAEEIFRVDDAARRIVLFRDSLLPRARESFKLTLSSYRTARAGVLDLIDAERALFELELSMWRACRDYYQGRARLKALVGGNSR